MNIAIIPARGGSKRIPRKNIRPFLGKPMMAYAIEAAQAAALFDHIVVSTDDDEIAFLAKRMGAEVPFARPRELSGDDAGTDAVVLHAVRMCQNIYGSIEYGCCIYPTSPFLHGRDLISGFTLLKERCASSAFPVVKYDFPIEQALMLRAGKPVARWPEHISKNSQEFTEHYHDAGSFYWFDVHKFVKRPELIGNDSVVFPIPSDRCQDINTVDDWEKAELKYRVMTAEAVL